MRKMWEQINNELWKIPKIDKEVAIGILMQANSEYVVEAFLKYLKSLDL